MSPVGICGMLFFLFKTREQQDDIEFTSGNMWISFLIFNPLIRFVEWKHFLVFSRAIDRTNCYIIYRIFKTLVFFQMFYTFEI